MNLSFSRRNWMKVASMAAIGSAVPNAWSNFKYTNGFPAGAAGIMDIPDYEKPLFHIHKQILFPVPIKSIELLKLGSKYFVKTTSDTGDTGIVRTKGITHYISIFENLVAPRFIGKDARDIETLVDLIYIKNYKLAGQSLFSPLAFIEQSIFDLLGRIAGKPAGELMGGRIREEIPVYLSGSARELSAEEEVDIYVRGVEETGAVAVKFKIGGRMSRNADAYPGRTDKLLELARKRLGDDIVLFADANGSYDAAHAIKVGRVLESLDFRFFEEPCPWQEYSETQEVTAALDIPIASGEVDSSLWQFKWMIDNKVTDIVQPDLNYNGGFTRTARVALMAESVGMKIIPHNTQTAEASVNILQFASRTPNMGEWIEYPWRKSQKKESWYTPNFIVKSGLLKIPEGPGLGIEIDPDYLSRAETIVRLPK